MAMEVSHKGAQCDLSTKAVERPKHQLLEETKTWLAMAFWAMIEDLAIHTYGVDVGGY